MTVPSIRRVCDEAPATFLIMVSNENCIIRGQGLRGTLRLDFVPCIGVGNCFRVWGHTLNISTRTRQAGPFYNTAALAPRPLAITVRRARAATRWGGTSDFSMGAMPPSLQRFGDLSPHCPHASSAYAMVSKPTPTVTHCPRDRGRDFAGIHRHYPSPYSFVPILLSPLL